MSSLAMTLMHFLWQAALIALVLKVILSLSKKQALKFRYYSAVVALSACAILPVYTFVSSYHQANLPTASEAAPIEQVVLPVVNQSVSGQFALEQSTSLWAQITHYFDYQFLVGLWAFGVLFMFAKLIYDLKQTYRLTRVGTSPVDEEIVEMVKQISTKFGIARRVSILKSSLVNVPVVIGWFKPTVLLPIAITIGLDRQQLELIIAHELAHVKRLDFLVNLVQGFIQVIFFYHPSIYWINKVVREEREYICDSMALTALNNSPTARLELAKALLNIEELKEGNLQLVAVAASDGHLKNRINRIVMNERLRMPSARGVLIAALALLFSFTAIAVTADMSANLQKNNQLKAPLNENPQVAAALKPVTSRETSQPTLVESRRTNEQSKLNSTPSPVTVFDDETNASEIDLSTVERVNSNQQQTMQTSKRANPLVDTETQESNVLISHSITRQPQSAVVQSSEEKQTLSLTQSVSKRSLAKNDVSDKNDGPVKNDAIKVAKIDSSVEENKAPLASIPDEVSTNENPSVESSAEIAPTKPIRVALIEKPKNTAFKEPIALKTPYPVYPAGAFKNNLKGRVKVDFVINEEGRVISPSFNEGTPWIFSREIRSKLKRWRYVPAEKNGQRIAYSSSVYFDFELPEREPLTHYQVGSRIKRKIR